MRRLFLPVALLCLLGSHANAMQVAPSTFGPGSDPDQIALHPVDPIGVTGGRDFWSGEPLREDAPVFEPSADATSGPPDGSTLSGVVAPESYPAPSSGVSALVSFTLAALLLSITLYVLLVVSQRRRYVLYLAPILAASTASLLLLVAIFGNPLSGIGIFGASALDGSASRAMTGSTLTREVLEGSPRSAPSPDGQDRNEPGHASFEAVPEPSSASLLGCGLGAIVWSRRHRVR